MRTKKRIFGKEVGGEDTIREKERVSIWQKKKGENINKNKREERIKKEHREWLSHRNEEGEIKNKEEMIRKGKRKTDKRIRERECKYETEKKKEN